MIPAHTSATDSDILGMVTGGKATASEGIALQQGILCSIAVKLVQKNRT